MPDLETLPGLLVGLALAGGILVAIVVCWVGGDREWRRRGD